VNPYGAPMRTPPLLLWLIPLTACGVPETGDSAAEGPTWNADIAPLVTERCGSCHTAGGIGPSFDTYGDAAPLASAMASAVASGQMPPWDAIETDECERRLPLANDPSLSDDDIALIERWAEDGAPEGDPATAAPIPQRPSLTLEDADQQVSPEAPFTPSGESDQFVCFVLDPELDETRWLTGLQVAPGDAGVVHHVLVFTDPDRKSLDKADADGQYDCFGSPGLSNTNLIAAWAPGAFPMQTPDGAGMAVEGGSLLVMQIHYHPRGREVEPDLTSLELRWADQEPEKKALLALVGNAGSKREGLLAGPDDEGDRPEFRIPAGVSDHTETIEYTLGDSDGPYTIFATGTHMHYIGTEMLISVQHADPQGDEPQDECLMETSWDFNWQRAYPYDAPYEDLPVLRGGDTLHLRCTYDNTLDNPGTVTALQDAGLSEPVDVYLGEETLDEMCLGVFGIIYE